MPDWLRRYVQPREGWLAAALLLVMLMSVVWSVQRAGWLDQAEFLAPVAFYALIAGALLGISNLSVVGVIPISASLGGLIVLWAVGGEYFPDLSQGGRLLALRGDAVDWIRILLDQGYAPQLTPYAIGLGLVMWVTAFIATYTLYRHHRVLDAILLIGTALIANMSATLTDLFVYLIMFVLAALVLWLRAALLGREEGWQRRRVNENSEVAGAIMRSGGAFIAGSVIMAWILTSVAVAAPLTAVWNNLDTAWTGIRDRLDLVLGGLNSGESRFHGTNFGPDFRISGQWTSSDEPVLTIAADRGLYLRATTYDQYTGRGWAQSPGRQRDVPSEAALFPDGTPEAPTIDAFTIATIEIAIEKTSDRTLYTAGYPIKAFLPVQITESGNQPFLGAVKAMTSIPSGASYSMTVALSEATQADLRSAGTDYPDAVRQLYLGTAGLTERTRALAEQAASEADNPYDRALALTRYLQGPDFEYNTTAPISTDPNRDAVDYFLFDPENGHIGFCEHYASAMVAMARSLGIPARLAAGFAPGDRVSTPVPAATGQQPASIWQVRLKNAHAWAELYFPGYGWQVFEATKTIAPVVRPRGETPAPGTSASQRPNNPRLFEPGETDAPGFALPSREVMPGGHRPGEDGPRGDGTGGNTLVITAILLVVLGVAVWRWRRARRNFQFLSPAERQWRRLALATERAGVGQRASETIYEYAGWLEEQLPARRPEIRAIADGKVQQSYSGRGLATSVVQRMEEAWKRLQLPLVWLAVRRRARSLLPGR
jgi:transglutaminase-like putative cysteine protease